MYTRKVQEWENAIAYRQQYEEWSRNCAEIVKKHGEQIRKRKGVAVAVAMLHSSNRRYTTKRFWVAPMFRKREEHGFFKAILPSVRLEDLRYHNYFRMSAARFEELLLAVGADLSKQCFLRDPIEVAERLALTLRFLASGDSMTSMSYQYLVGVTTVSTIISETCEVLWNKMSPLVIPPVLEEEEWLKIAHEFNDTWNFPNCIGAIDGKHVVIQCPNNAGSAYYNYKASHSIVLLAICDANYVFRFVDIGAHGRRSDGGIFKNSIIGENFENNKMYVPESAAISGNGPILPFCLVGDEAFPLKPYMLRPYPGKDKLPLTKRVFNYRLSRARRTIENSFGILANKWRIFRKPIISSVDTATKIVQAVICLHNFLRIEDISNNSSLSYLEPELVDRDSQSCVVPGMWRSDSLHSSAFREITRAGANMSRREAVEIRDEFCHYFNNDGAVAWQYDCL